MGSKVSTVLNVAAANEHLADTAPWALARKADSAPRVGAILHHACRTLEAMGRALVAFLPATATAIADALAAPDRTAPVLFPRRDLEPWRRHRVAPGIETR